jgi:hypothetical protein
MEHFLSIYLYIDKSDLLNDYAQREPFHLVGGLQTHLPSDARRICPGLHPEDPLPEELDLLPPEDPPLHLEPSQLVPGAQTHLLSDARRTCPGLQPLDDEPPPDELDLPPPEDPPPVVHLFSELFHFSPRELSHMHLPFFQIFPSPQTHVLPTATRPLVQVNSFPDLLSLPRYF